MFDFGLPCFRNKVKEEKRRQESVQKKAFSVSEKPERALTHSGRPGLTSEGWGPWLGVGRGRG